MVEKKVRTEPTGVRRAWIEPDHPALSVVAQCELLGLARSGWYYAAVPESVLNQALMRRMDEEYTAHPFYGSRRMTAVWRRAGYPVNRKRVIRLMTELGLQAIYPKPATSQPGTDHRVYPYLLRGMAVTVPDQVWSTDITYIRLTGGFVYLVAILDWYSRKVLGVAVVEYLGDHLLLGVLGRGPGAPPADDLQHRPRSPVHQPRLHGSLGASRGPDQYGWSGTGA